MVRFREVNEDMETEEEVEGRKEGVERNEEDFTEIFKMLKKENIRLSESDVEVKFG